MLASLPVATEITLIVTIIIALCGGVGVLLQVFLKDLYRRTEKITDKFFAVDQRIDNVITLLNKEVAEINQKLAMIPLKEELLIDKVNDLKKAQEDIVNILKDILISGQNKGSNLSKD